MNNIRKSITIGIAAIIVVSFALALPVETATAADEDNGNLKITENYVQEGTIMNITVSDSDFNVNTGSKDSIIVNIESGTEDNSAGTSEQPSSGAATYTTENSVWDNDNSNTITTADFSVEENGDASIDSVNSVNSNGTVTLSLDNFTGEDNIVYNAGETARLAETDVDTGVFDGSQLVDNSDSVGTLQIADGDTVTASYYDAYDGSRSGNNQDTAKADNSAPTLSSAVTVQSGVRDDNNQIKIEFSEVSGLDKDSVAPEDFKVNSGNIDGSGDTAELLTDNTVLLTYDNSATELSAFDTGDSLSVTLGDGDNVKDKLGHVLDSADADNITATDNIGPVMDSAVYNDNNNDGAVDNVVVTYSENIDGDLGAENWSIVDPGSVNLSSPSSPIIISSENSVALGVSGDSDITGGPAKPKVEYSGGNLTDDNNNVAATESITATDNASPTIYNLEIMDENGDGLIDKAVLKFTEDVNTADDSAPVAENIPKITLPDGSIAKLTSADISDPGGTSSQVTITGIENQENVNTAVGSTDVSGGVSSDWVDGSGNNLVSSLDDETVTDSAMPILNTAAYTPISDTEPDNLVVSFSENIVFPGLAEDYSATYDADENLKTTENNRDVAVKGLSDATMDENITLSIEDQSQHRDNGGVFRITLEVTANVEDVASNTVNPEGVSTKSGTVDNFDDNRPTVSSITTMTENTIAVEFDENLAESTLEKDNFSVGSGSYVINSAKETSDGVVTLTLDNVLATDTTPSVSFENGTLTDIAGNLAENSDLPSTTDGIAPNMDNALTGPALENITVNFSENLESSTVNLENFSVTNYNVENAVETSNGVVTLTLKSNLARDATPTVTLTGGTLADNENNVTATSETFSVEAIDNLGPVLQSITWNDVNGDDNVTPMDNLKFAFAEAMDISTIDAANVNDVLDNADNLSFGSAPNVTWSPDNTAVTVKLSSGENISKSTSIKPMDSVTDEADNPDNSISGLEVAGAPSVGSAVTKDADADGRIDTIVVQFDEQVDGDTIAQSSFSVAGYSGESVTDAVTDDNQVTVTFTESGSPDTDATPDVTIDAGAIKDLGGTAIESENKSEISETDGAAPVLLWANIQNENSDADGTDNESYVKATFSENVDTSDPGTGLFINGSSVATPSEQDTDDNDSTYTVAVDNVVQSATDNITQVANDVVDNTSQNNNAVLYKTSNVDIDAFRRTLTAGWNYVSFPIADGHTYSVTEWFSDNAVVDVVWSYDSSWDTAWGQQYDPDNPVNPGEFDIVAGRGYEVKIKSGQSMTLAPNVYTKPGGGQAYGTPMSFALEKGWNLIGQVQEFNQLKENAFANTTPTISPLYRYYSTGLSTTTTMYAGEAYWAYAQSSGDYVEGTGTNET